MRAFTSRASFQSAFEIRPHSANLRAFDQHISLHEVANLLVQAEHDSIFQNGFVWHLIARPGRTRAGLSHTAYGSDLK
jgi:hypothetical protein